MMVVGVMTDLTVKMTKGEKIKNYIKRILLCNHSSKIEDSCLTVLFVLCWLFFVLTNYWSWGSFTFEIYIFNFRLLTLAIGVAHHFSGVTHK